MKIELRYMVISTWLLLCTCGEYAIVRVFLRSAFADNFNANGGIHGIYSRDDRRGDRGFALKSRSNQFAVAKGPSTEISSCTVQ